MWRCKCSECRSCGILLRVITFLEIFPITATTANKIAFVKVHICVCGNYESAVKFKVRKCVVLRNVSTWLYHNHFPVNQSTFPNLFDVRPADVQSASRTCTDLPRRSVSTSGISWQQTETVICYLRRPRHQPNCHALWCPVICRCRTRSLESASGRHSCDWLSQLL